MFPEMCAPSSRKHLKVKSENSLLKHLKVSHVCTTFFSNSKKIAVLEEMVLWWEATPTSLYPAGCPVDHTGKW